MNEWKTKSLNPCCNGIYLIITKAYIESLVNDLS